MSMNKILLFVFCVVFNAAANASSLGKDFGATLNFGLLSVGRVDAVLAPSIELYTYNNESTKTPQRVFFGYASILNDQSTHRGRATAYYLGYDFASKINLYRKIRPLASVGVSYAYIDESGVFSTDADGFATSQPENKTYNGFTGYIGLREVYKISRERFEFSVRYNFGAVAGLSVSVGKRF